MIRVADHTATAMAPIKPVVVWSGNSAKTQPRVDHYLTIPDRGDFIRASADIVHHFADNPIAMLRENADLLMHMSVGSGLPYMTPSLAGIRTLARRFGGEAKPSGAGGGDCAIALFPDPDAERAFIAAVTERGRTVIPVNVAGPAGLLG